MIEGTLLSEPLQKTLGGIKLTLDSMNSVLSIPGLINKQFTVPVIKAAGPVFILFPPGFTLFPTNYAANIIVSTGSMASHQRGSLVLTVHFADNDDAFHADSTASKHLREEPHGDRNAAVGLRRCGSIRLLSRPHGAGERELVLPRRELIPGSRSRWIFTRRSRTVCRRCSLTRR